jgi:tight adherence protein B
VGALAVLLEAPVLGGACLLVSVLVLPVLRRLRARRVMRLNRQLDGWLLAISGTLEATPSLGEALRASLVLVERPLRDELQEMQHELDFGRPLRDALTGLGWRAGSQPLQAVLGALEVGRGAGGELPEVLRNLSVALRELSRLQDVLRAKTAEGRAQAFAIALVPLPLYFGVRYVDADYFRPLETTAIGHLLLVAVVVLWASALLLARRILAVAL